MKGIEILSTVTRHPNGWGISLTLLIAIIGLLATGIVLGILTIIDDIKDNVVGKDDIWYSILICFLVVVLVFSIIGLVNLVKKAETAVYAKVSEDASWIEVHSNYRYYDRNGDIYEFIERE